VLAAADACLVHFKRREIFTTILPSKLFEDAAMAKPILLGFEGHAAELVRTADCGIAFTPEDDEALAAAAERLAADPEEARRLGENGRRHVLARFDRQKLAHDYLAILERVCDARRRPS
jgi:glycosyltransferase involved in cell wall biosynthesis